jgi:putative resolvase
MKSKEVIKLLGVTRPTLTKYVKEGILRKAKVVSEEYLHSLGNRGDVLSPFKISIF